MADASDPPADVRDQETILPDRLLIPEFSGLILQARRFVVRHRRPRAPERATTAFEVERIADVRAEHATEPREWITDASLGEPDLLTEGAVPEAGGLAVE